MVRYRNSIFQILLKVHVVILLSVHQTGLCLIPGGNKENLSKHVREMIKIFIKDYLNFMPNIISLENMHINKK